MMMNALPAMLSAWLPCASASIALDPKHTDARIKIVSRSDPDGRRRHMMVRMQMSGAAAGHTDPLAFHVGWNHPEAVWQPCDPADAECRSYDIFRKKWGGNRTAAALAMLPLYEQYHFTAAGYDSATEHRVLPFMKLTMPLHGADHRGGPSSWTPDLVFPDVWNSTVRRQTAANILSACEDVRPHRQNLIGYIWTDTPAFDIKYAQQERGHDWVSSLRCLPAGAPGRQQYNDFLRQRFANNLPAVCSAYGAPRSKCNSSWHSLDLCNVQNTDSERMMADDYAFLPSIVREYYSLCNTTIKQCDPEANVFVDTIRSVLTPDSVIKLVGEFADAVSYQPDDKYINMTELLRVHTIARKPLLIADIGFGFPHEPYNKTEWHQYASEREAAAAYEDYVVSSAKSDFIVGLNKCQIIDRVVKQPFITLKPGTLNFDWTPHQPFADLVAAANKAAIAVDHTYTSAYGMN
eukprot:SAG31_NODE_2921_length_4909_cov_2.815385_2_plen_463_part_00